MEEIWKPIPGFEGFYEVSNLGRFQSLRSNSAFRESPRALKLKLHHDGYLRVRLSKENKKYTPIAHRIVASVFIHNSESKPHVNHINSVRIDNRVENLEWVTPKENIQHAIKQGRFKFMTENLLKNRKNRKTAMYSVCHPSKTAVGAKNLCGACYMKDLRRTKKLSK